MEGTFFALLMSVYNAGIQVSQWTGGHLYDSVGFERLVLISTGGHAADLHPRAVRPHRAHRGRRGQRRGQLHGRSPRGVRTPPPRRFSGFGRLGVGVRRLGWRRGGQIANRAAHDDASSGPADAALHARRSQRTRARHVRPRSRSRRSTQPRSGESPVRSHAGLAQRARLVLAAPGGSTDRGPCRGAGSRRRGGRRRSSPSDRTSA